MFNLYPSLVTKKKTGDVEAAENKVSRTGGAGGADKVLQKLSLFLWCSK